jgi:hypothetical protein
MRPNNDAQVDLKRRMIVLTGTRCTYFELKTNLNIKCKKAYTGSPLKQYVFMKIPIIELFKLALDMLIWHLFFPEILSST